ncbi:DUF6578 domain-containing protein [Herbiconiux solani]|uniref:DUF6578 domain-containing protein n=1 Tax=Herbiconiux solani TaxID=661329 RepID=UPI0008267614|nr:DUF6578 domain-containing protein [Herbiconiux solani]
MTAADPTGSGTTRIGVTVSGWEQGCCGAAFRVGDTVTWDVFWAGDGNREFFGPAEAEGVDFAETHHGGTDVGPLAPITGRVVAIRAMSQRKHRPDPAGPWTNVLGESTSTPVDEVPGRTTITFEDATPAAPTPPRRMSPPDPSDPRVFIPSTGGWYAVARAERPPDHDETHAEQRVPAGWIVHLDVPADTTLTSPS